jgi:hypothetical protein
VGKGGLLASAVTASLSWPDVPTAHWLVRACWYVSLCMVITSVLVAFQQVAGLGGILATRGSHTSLYSALLDSSGRPDIKTIFVLQVPVQLLSYSIFFYTLGLAVHVMRPLGSRVWGDGMKVRSAAPPSAGRGADACRLGSSTASASPSPSRYLWSVATTACSCWTARQICRHTRPRTPSSTAKTASHGGRRSCIASRVSRPVAGPRMCRRRRNRSRAEWEA